MAQWLSLISKLKSCSSRYKSIRVRPVASASLRFLSYWLSPLGKIEPSTSTISNSELK